ncbi:MAG: GNAT family N-acetyltransferase [Myxococcales bacterium]
MAQVEITLETPADHAAIRALNEEAFDGPGEARLVDALRSAGAATLSLVARRDGRVVGHLLLSPVRIESADGVRPALGLAPMAVARGLQRSGIGTALVREALARARDAGHGAVVVLGHPDYYPRFGFVRASRFGLTCEFPSPDEAFMAVELRPGCLAGAAGRVSYHAAFHDL